MMMMMKRSGGAVVVKGGGGDGDDVGILGDEVSGDTLDHPHSHTDHPRSRPSSSSYTSLYSSSSSDATTAAEDMMIVRDHIHHHPHPHQHQHRTISTTTSRLDALTNTLYTDSSRTGDVCVLHRRPVKVKLPARFLVKNDSSQQHQEQHQQEQQQAQYQQKQQQQVLVSSTHVPQLLQQGFTTAPAAEHGSDHDGSKPRDPPHLDIVPDPVSSVRAGLGSDDMDHDNRHDGDLFTASVTDVVNDRALRKVHDRFIVYSMRVMSFLLLSSLSSLLFSSLLLWMCFSLE
jgi:hypothetical protein